MMALHVNYKDDVHMRLTSELEIMNLQLCELITVRRTYNMTLTNLLYQ